MKTEEEKNTAKIDGRRKKEHSSDTKFYSFDKRYTDNLTIYYFTVHLIGSILRRFELFY